MDPETHRLTPSWSPGCPLGRAAQGLLGREHDLWGPEAEAHGKQVETGRRLGLQVRHESKGEVTKAKPSEAGREAGAGDGVGVEVIRLTLGFQPQEEIGKDQKRGVGGIGEEHLSFLALSP